LKEKVVAKPQSSGAKCAITDEAVVKCPNLVLSSYPRRYYIQGHRLTATASQSRRSWDRSGWRQCWNHFTTLDYH